MVSGDELNFTREAQRIQRLAQASDARVVTLGQIAFFSTATGDAWMLDLDDGFAVCLAQEFAARPIPIKETDQTLAIQWNTDFEIEGDKFTVAERIGSVQTFAGYPTDEIERLTQEVSAPVIPAQAEREAAQARLKSGRNDSCPCGSGKKYKKCCLPKDEITVRRPVSSVAKPPVVERTEKRLSTAGSLAEEPAASSDEVAGPDSTHAEGADNNPKTTTLEAEEEEKDEEEEEGFQHSDLSEEENRIANEWWAQVEEHYLEKPNGGEVLSRLHAFLNEHPRLFQYLNVEDEMLLELEPMLREQGRSHDYLALLRRVRREQPETYRRCFGWFDYALIADAVARGALTEIPPCFSFFQEKAEDSHGHLDGVFHLLAWAGCESELFDLAESTLDIDPTTDNWAWNASARWLCLRESLPFLTARASAPDDVRQLLSAQRKVLGLGSEVLDNHDWARHQLESAACEAKEWKLPSLPGRNGQGYADVMRNFAGWLVRNRRCLWVTAVCLSRLAWEHWVWASHRPRSKDPFEMKSESLTRYFNWKDGGDFWMGGVEPFAFIQATAWFGDYLLAGQNLTEAKRSELHRVCNELYALALENHSPQNAALRLYPTFDALIAGLKVSHADAGPDR